MLIEMLPFIAPKLSAVGYMREADTFATQGLSERLSAATAQS
jgi:hypothetical protein